MHNRTNRVVTFFNNHCPLVIFPATVHRTSKVINNCHTRLQCSNVMHWTTKLPPKASVFTNLRQIKKGLLILFDNCSENPAAPSFNVIFNTY